MAKGKKVTGDFRKFMDKNFLGSWDVPEGGDLVLTIDHIEQEEVQNQQGTELKLTAHFVEDYKPMILNVTNSKTIGKVVGSNHVEKWAGQKIAIYVASVSAFGTVTEALRIRDYAPKTDEIICADCGQVITGVGKYSAKVIAERSKTKFGVHLCSDCAKARAESQEGGEA